MNRPIASLPPSNCNFHVLSAFFPNIFASEFCYRLAILLLGKVESTFGRTLYPSHNEKRRSANTERRLLFWRRGRDYSRLPALRPCGAVAARRSKSLPAIWSNPLSGSNPSYNKKRRPANTERRLLFWRRGRDSNLRCFLYFQYVIDGSCLNAVKYTRNRPEERAGIAQKINDRLT